MFDPTVYENLKVAFENQLYDLDTLDRKIDIINRADHLDLAVLSREFRLQFKLAEYAEVSAEIQLIASLKDLADEILELTGETPACSMRIRFFMQVTQVAEQCDHIKQVMKQIWEPEIEPVQTISFVYNSEAPIYSNVIELNFSRKIGEEQMDDIPELAAHVLKTLKKLREITVQA